MIYKHYIKTKGKDGANNDIITEVKLYPDHMENENPSDFICINENSSRKLPVILNKSWDGENIVEYTLSLEEYKGKKIKQLSSQSFEHELKHVPKYKKMNALIGIYSEAKNKNILDFGSIHCRKAFYDALALIDNATTKEQIELISVDWPVWSDVE